ncbi:short-chain dehydrogenase [Lineolata rhizophorae]|uniref:Short-chain dehydrogenase n=1 Tax=Lineolata rhizophorae TaxID=578093 RepID=A0A6A6NR97_9PEZI|nr:short-chain dehydrogenase [Lineolata rhizophorae]
MSGFGFHTTSEEVCNKFSSEIKGKTFLITGCSPSGLGAEMARTLALHSPGLLILAGRRLEALHETAAEVKQSDPSVTVRLLKLDLASLAQVREAAAEVLRYPEPIHCLINNAGLSGIPYKLSEDGIELLFAINHVGHFLFTNLIMPRILTAGPGARVVNLSSVGHLGSPIRFDDINFKKGDYTWVKAYGQSKTANILFSLSLADKLKDKEITAFSLHPGAIRTNIWRHFTTDYMFKQGWVDEEGNSTEGVIHWKNMSEGAATSLVAALDPELSRHSGAYLDDCQICSAAPYAMDKDNAEKLWKLTEELVGQKFEY